MPHLIPIQQWYSTTLSLNGIRSITKRKFKQGCNYTINKGIMLASLVIFYPFFWRWKLTYTVPSKHVYETSFDEIRPKIRVFSLFLCAVCLAASLIMHVPISELHAQWHWCLHFNMKLNSQRFLQFHPTVMLVVAYVNYCFIIIHQNLFSCFIF